MKNLISLSVYITQHPRLEAYQLKLNNSHGQGGIYGKTKVVTYFSGKSLKNHRFGGIPVTDEKSVSALSRV